ncbi:hypothetical protein [Phenylobacterium sp.]|uniref:hypothetical protein n=1 Tax=Phenylobacterium sp. TaxID=1871053 RepID=UPI0025D007EE|nr:hypothetical protein [Phenylobacterium sp.]MBX3482071.1 hypothetical protein [Phenylobacterium sp.]MCW5761071.1 hypothetical protein [Phenylobacterium sp.]
MKKIALIALAAASLGAVAAPAAAQDYRHDGYRHDAGRYDQPRWDYRHDWDRGFNVNQMQNQLNDRIFRGIRSGRLTQSEARSLRSQFQEIARIEANYRRGGLNASERRDLERRLVAFETRLDRQLRDGQYARR